MQVVGRQRSSRLLLVPAGQPLAEDAALAHASTKASSSNPDASNSAPNDHSSTNDTMAQNNSLTAAYASPTSTQTFSFSLPCLPSDPKAQTVQAKTEYLAALRANASNMQGDINNYLTKRMEEDKAAESGDAKVKSKDEEKEEEMYGEEDPEQDG